MFFMKSWNFLIPDHEFSQYKNLLLPHELLAVEI